MHELTIGNTSLRRLTATSETLGPVCPLTLQRNYIDMTEPYTPLSLRLCPATRSLPGSMSTMTLIKYSQEHRGSTSTPGVTVTRTQHSKQRVAAGRRLGSLVSCLSVILV